MFLVGDWASSNWFTTVLNKYNLDDNGKDNNANE